jgi:hypothetical protein
VSQSDGKPFQESQPRDIRKKQSSLESQIALQEISLQIVANSTSTCISSIYINIKHIPREIRDAIDYENHNTTHIINNTKILFSNHA